MISRLLIERTSPKDGKFSASALNDMGCPRYFYNKYIKRFGIPNLEPKMFFGSMFHIGVGTFYADRNKGSYEEARAAALEAIQISWDSTEGSADIPADSPYGYGALKGLLGDYMFNYMSDSTKYDEARIEAPLLLPMPNGTIFIMVLDRVKRIGNSFNVVVDTKTTTSALTDFYFKKYENDFQTTGYMYGLKESIGNCDSIEIDAVKVQKGEGTDKVRFSRQTFMRTDRQMSEFINSYCRKTDFIMKGWAIQDPVEQEQYFHMEHSDCGNWGGCRYLPLCVHGSNHPSVRAEYGI